MATALVLRRGYPRSGLDLRDVNIVGSKIGSLAQYGSMNRDLEIALVSGALAIIWGYALQLRLREGFVQHAQYPTASQPLAAAYRPLSRDFLGFIRIEPSGFGMPRSKFVDAAQYR